jgi:hypothetical protein
VRGFSKRLTITLVIFSLEMATLPGESLPGSRQKPSMPQLRAGRAVRALLFGRRGPGDGRPYEFVRASAVV